MATSLVPCGQYIRLPLPATLGLQIKGEQLVPQHPLLAPFNYFLKTLSKCLYAWIASLLDGVEGA